MTLLNPRNKKGVSNENFNESLKLVRQYDLDRFRESVGIKDTNYERLVSRSCFYTSEKQPLQN